jgi:circadian clock protein KaiC
MMSSGAAAPRATSSWWKAQSAQELRSPDSLLLEAAAQMGAQRIFIDSISLLRTVSNQGNHATDDDGNGMDSYRQLLQQLLEGLQRENLTALLSHEVTAVPQQAFALEVTEFLCDTVIVLRRELHRRGTRRSLEVTKSRGQDYDTDQHTLRITSGQGLEVFRRVQAPPREFAIDPQPTSSTRQSIIGSAPLDELFGGGVFDGSVTVVVGVSGVGKTVLGMQLLLEGATHQRHGLVVSLDEYPEQVMRNTETLAAQARHPARVCRPAGDARSHLSPNSLRQGH